MSDDAYEVLDHSVSILSQVYSVSQLIVCVDVIFVWHEASGEPVCGVRLENDGGNIISDRKRSVIY